MIRKLKLYHRRKRPSAATLFEGSTSNQTDAARPSAISSEHARDLKWQMTPANWRQMLSVGRFLYANLGPVHGAVNEIATYAVGDAWIPQYQGAVRWLAKLLQGLRQVGVAPSPGAVPPDDVDGRLNGRRTARNEFVAQPLSIGLSLLAALLMERGYRKDALCAAGPKSNCQHAECQQSR